MRTAVRTVNPAVVRSYDIRGRFGQQLSCDDAYALGLAYASVAGRRALWRVAVCRDGRLSSPSLEAALINGLLDGGMHVYPVGLGPTPLLYYAVQAARLDGGIMVTGSHNPKEENGFKLLLSGNPIFGRELRDLVSSVPVFRSGGMVRRLVLHCGSHPPAASAGS